MGVQTDGAADAKQVYVPAPHEQGVHRAHYASITRACTACPSRPRHWGRRMRGLLMWHHLGANACIRRAYSAPLENTKNVTGPRCAGLGGLRRPAGLMALLSAGQRRSAPVSAGQRRSALADPGHRRLGLTGRKVLAITPGAAGAVVVMALPPWNADHAPIFPLFFPLSLAGRMKSALPAISRRQDEVRAAARSCWHRAAARTS